MVCVINIYMLTKSQDLRNLVVIGNKLYHKTSKNLKIDVMKFSFILKSFSRTFFKRLPKEKLKSYGPSNKLTKKDSIKNTSVLFFSLH